jgi:hypothetical protein
MPIFMLGGAITAHEILSETGPTHLVRRLAFSVGRM